MHEYRKSPDRDYSIELAHNLDPSLWDYSYGTHNKEQLMSIFSSYALRMGDVSESDHWKKEVDPVHEYTQNSYGYRDPAYTGPVDLLAGGCSQTFGQGVHLDGRWSNQLGESLGMSVATIAVPGWSTQSTISAIMHYIKRYGNPKIIALYLPDFFRFDTMINSNYSIPDLSYEDPNYSVRISHASRAEPNADTPKYAKRPFPLDKVINAEAALFATGQSIVRLSEYCREAGIDLVWGTWDFRFDYMVRHIKSLVFDDRDLEYMSARTWGVGELPVVQLDEYVDMEFYQHESGTVEEFAAMSCHQELRDKYGDCCFDRATDAQDHMGVHIHAHVAEKFYDRLMEIKNLKG